MERHLAPLALLAALAGCAQFPPLTADGDADTDADADVTPIDCGSGLEAIDLNRAGSAVPNGFTYSGTIVAGPGAAQSLCNATSGSEVIFAFVPEAAGDLVVDTFGSDPMLDTVLHVRTQCAAAGTEVACNEDWWGNRCYRSAIEIDDAASPGTPYYIFVDTWDAFTGGNYTVTAVSRPTVAIGGTCDPERRENRCVDGARCQDGACQASSAPTISALQALAVPNANPTVRIALRGADDDMDVVDAHFIFDIPPQMSLDWTQRLDPLEWDGANYVSYTDWDMTGFPATTSVTVSVIDASNLESEPRTATVVSLPRRAVGEACDADEYDDWCQDGLVCNAGTCAASGPPTISQLIVRNLPYSFRATVVGADPDGNATGVEYTFINSENVDMPEVELGYGTDILQTFAWPVKGLTTFTAGFETIQPPTGATGLRVEIVDYAFNQSDSIRDQGEAMPQLASGDACDPTALADQCAETCSPDTGQCVDAAACQQQACGRALPVLTPGTPALVQLHTFDPGCFNSSCGESPGPEAIFTLSVPARSRLSLVASKRSGALYRAALSVRAVCAQVATELGCGDTWFYFPGCSWDYAPGPVFDFRTDFDGLEIDSIEPGTYYVIADSMDSPGDFELLAELTPI